MGLSFVRFVNGALAALLLVVPSISQAPSPDQFTPVLVSPLVRSTQSFLATDGKYHVDYELQITNAKPTPATLKKIEVLDASNPSTVIASYQDDALLGRLRTMACAPAKTAEIEFNGARLFLIDLTFDTRAQVPSRLEHRIAVLGAPTPAPVPVTPMALTYTVAQIDVHSKVLEIGPPLKGKGWVALNGCCGLSGAHRPSGQSVNGGMFFAQRFAIDWMRLDESGRLVHGDESDVHSFADYGADVIAVADGKVVSTLNTLEDQQPGKLPDPATITIANVDGNHVVLDLGNGVFAFYAHMQKGSVLVVPGQTVKRGQLLGKLGNTGNTSAPHLHFHLMDGPSVLGSSGLPYVIDSFVLAGRIPADKDPALADSMDGSYPLSSNPSPRHGEYPLNLDVVEFPGATTH